LFPFYLNTFTNTHPFNSIVPSFIRLSFSHIKKHSIDLNNPSQEGRIISILEMCQITRTFREFISLYEYPTGIKYYYYESMRNNQFTRTTPATSGPERNLFSTNLFIHSLAVVFACLFLAASAVYSADTKPNVILLVSDDQGWGDVGYHGGEPSTPNIDQLVKDGLEMNRWYSYPWCGPTRTSLLTGHISMRHGTFSGSGNLTHDEQLMNEAFKDEGYITMTAGKWHLGMRTQRDFPINRGFDHTYGSLNAGVDYWTHTSRGDRIDWARDGKTVFEGGYTTDLFGNEISRLIRERDKSKPFFSYVAFTAPHSPLQAPQSYVDKYAHIEDMNRRVYCAMVEVLDVAIGNILKTIDDEGIRDNTLVLFFSDNGGAVRTGADNGDFRGGKTNVYEGGTRMPAVFRWPGKIPAGVKSEQPMVVYDLFPTLAEGLGIPTNINTPFDGESLWDVIQTGKTRPRKTDMIIGTGNSYSVHSGDYKLVHSNINGNQPAGSETVELFKIYDDPNETTNVAKEYPDVAEQIMAKSAYAADWVRNSATAQPGRGGQARQGRGARRPQGSLQRYDTDGDGIVLENEVDEGDLERFATADTNHDGKIDADEFAAARAARGGPRGRRGRPDGGGPGAPGGRGAGGGQPAPTLDANGNIIHWHESVPSD
jgi:arylsulfatase A-like enzyme